MTPIEEKRHLIAVLAQLERPSSKVPISWWMTILFGVIAMALTMVIHRTGVLFSPLTTAFIFLFLGIGFGVSLHIARSWDSWPIIRPHFSRESIRARIDELGA